MTKDKDDQSATPDPGIFITKGMQVAFPSISIRFKDDGSIKVDPLTLHIGLDLCPYWIEIALMHLEESEKAHEALLTGKRSQDSEAIAEALRNDFTACMQTIMASAIAIDAYYSNIKERSNITNELVQTWKKNGTARYKQVAEVFRIAFLIPEKFASQLRDILKEIFSFRDKAVHPPSGTTAPVLHPELNKVSDWRYSTFRNYNAKEIVKTTLIIIDQTSHKPNAGKHEKLESYCQAVVVSIEPLIKRWEQKYGKLYG